MGVPETVTELLEPVVATLDVELVDVEYTGGTLRLTVDRADGISTDALADVNRLVSPILDQHDPVPGRYTLEVSSPGVERPLKRTEHYRRAVGEDVIVKLNPPAEPRRMRGTMLEATDDDFVLEAVEVDGVDLTEPEVRRIDYGDVSKARTVFDWGPAPKPGGGSKRSKKRGGAKRPSGTGRNQSAANGKKEER